MSDEALRKHMALQQANQHNHKQTAQGQQDNKNPAALNVIDELFTRLKAITSVGSAFKTASEEAIVKQEWMLAFREEGVTKQSMIDDGIEAVRVKARQSRSTTWFPSVGEFIDACKGSDDMLERAEIAYRIFSNPKWGEKQVCNIGVMVVSQHGFDLKAMKASDGKKQFIEFYLELASNNEFKHLDAFAITETVQLSDKQLKEAEKRTESAKNEFFDKFNAFTAKNPEIPAEAVEKAIEKHHGIKQGSLKQYAKTPAQLEEEKKRQLAMIKGMKQ